MAILPDYFVYRLRVKDMKTIEVEPVDNPDVVIVTRCKNCLFGIVDDPDFPNQYFCSYSGDSWNHALHFCANGEPRKRKEISNGRNKKPDGPEPER